MGRISVVIALFGALAVPATAAARSDPDADFLEIQWSMPERFGPDADADGRIDFPNTTAYVHNRLTGCDPCPLPRFAVRIETDPGTIPVRMFSWTIFGSMLDEPLQLHGTEPVVDTTLPEGVYRVDLTASVETPWGVFPLGASSSITVNDLLVVTIGDSYAGGEGNPEVRRQGSELEQWGDGGDEAAVLGHIRAHRSTVAWPARTALALEQADPHSSVTFISTAASGDRVDNGILVPSRFSPEAQIDQVAALIGNRQIDVLLVQEGGNSIGFTRVVRALVEADPLFDPVCYHLMVDQAFASVRDGNWGRGTSLQFNLPFDWSCNPAVGGSGVQLPGLDGLDDTMDRLADGLSRFDIGRVVLVGYPDPTGAGAQGERCREIVGDVTPPVHFHEISREEGELGVSEVVEPLNAALEAAAAEHGWLFVGGIAEAFSAGHGYCAPWPDYGYPEDASADPGFSLSVLDYADSWYRNPGRLSGPAQQGGLEISWYRNAAQSSVLQGPAEPFATTGTLHPNEIGHAAIARIVLLELGD